MKIYFKESEGATNVKELFDKGYTYMYFAITYLNPECTIQQCHSARRSFLDLYWIAKTYFPDTTKKQAAKIILDKCTCFYCSNIKKLVFYKSFSYQGFKFALVCGPQYNEDFKDSSKRSYNDLIKLAE